jgi:uncharacterized protein
LGGIGGTAAAKTLARRRGALSVAFAAVIFCVALYMLYRFFEKLAA